MCDILRLNSSCFCFWRLFLSALCSSSDKPDKLLSAWMTCNVFLYFFTGTRVHLTYINLCNTVKATIMSWQFRTSKSFLKSWFVLLLLTFQKSLLNHRVVQIKIIVSGTYVYKKSTKKVLYFSAKWITYIHSYFKENSTRLCCRYIIHKRSRIPELFSLVFSTLSYCLYT